MEGVTCSLCSPGRAGWCPWSGRWDFPHTLGTYSAGHSQCHRVPAGDRIPRAEPLQGCASWPPPPPGAGGCAGEGCDPCGLQELWGLGGGSPCLTLPLQQPEGKDLCCCYWCAWHQAALGLPLLFLPMELAPSLAPRPGGMLLLGSGQRKDTSLCRSMQGWIAPGWICTLNPFPGTREILCSSPSPQGQLQAGPFLLLLFLPFLGSAYPQIPGELRPLGSHGSLGVRGFPAREQGDVSSSTAWATGHGTLQRRLAFQLHVNGSWKEKVSVVFPSCLPGGDNLDFLECKVVLGHLSACRQSEVMESGLELTPGAREVWVQARSRERPFSWGSALVPPKV